MHFQAEICSKHPHKTHIRTELTCKLRVDRQNEQYNMCNCLCIWFVLGVAVYNQYLI